MNRTYPDQAGLWLRGDGSGFNILADIIHDFLDYNKRVGRNLSDLLEKSLNPARLNLIRRVADLSSVFGFPIYIVGGFVRDLILGRGSVDFDLLVEGDATTLAGALARKYGGRAVIHSRFKTAKWFFPGTGPGDQFPAAAASQPLRAGFLDLVSARSEAYRHPAALPTVKLGTFEQDIFRRDFTINTLAIRLDGPGFGELRDDLNAMDDLQKGLVRVLHPRSFQDDPTRMFRAVRYEQRHRFTIADDTRVLIPEGRKWIDSLSAQRIRRELDLILEEPAAVPMLDRLAHLDLLEPIHAALIVDRPVAARIARADDPSLEPAAFNVSAPQLRWLLWLMSLSDHQIKAVHERLHFTAALLASLKSASQLVAELPSFVSLRPSQWVERLEKYPLAAVYAVSLAFPGRELKQYLGEWRHVRPHATGHELKKRGLKPGAKYQSILRRLRNAWLDGELMSAQDEERLLEEVLLPRADRPSERT